MSYYIYILTNYDNRVMYIGVTNNLYRRWYEHKNGLIDGFTKRYNLHNLVYFEEYNQIKEAIQREKQLKKWNRKKKNYLIEQKNPDWLDFAEQWGWKKTNVDFNGNKDMG